MFAVWSLRCAIYLHQSLLEVYYKVKLWLEPPKLEDKVWKSWRVTVVGGFPRGVSRPKTQGAAGPEGVWSRDFPGSSIRRCAQYTGTVHVRGAQW